MALRLVVADDNFLVREGLAALLAEVDEIEVVAMASDPVSLWPPMTRLAARDCRQVNSLALPRRCLAEAAAVVRMLPRAAARMWLRCPPRSRP